MKEQGARLRFGRGTPLMSSAPKFQTGFTLVEVLIAVALITTLMAMALPAMQGVRERAALSRGRAELALIAQALEGYRRAYGDYPQTGDFAQAAATMDEPLSVNHAQSKLLNALVGIFGPAMMTAGGELDGPQFLETGKLTLEAQPAAVSKTDEPPIRREACDALLDPWGRRYLYYYKRASAAAAWTAPGYWLYSAGPDGRHQPPDRTSGAVAAGWSAGANADNVWGSVPR